MSYKQIYYRSNHITDMHLFDKNTGIIVGHQGGIYKTTDGGKSWSLKYKNATPDQPLNQVLFTHDQVGYVVGGANWSNSVVAIQEYH